MRRDEFLRLTFAAGGAIPALLAADESERVIQLDATALSGGLEATRVELREGALVMDARKWNREARGVVVTDVIDLGGDDGVVSNPATVRDLRAAADATPGVSLEVRTGSTYFQRPGTWSEWAKSTGADQPTGRYAQVRLQMLAENAETPPSARSVTLRFRLESAPTNGKVRVTSSSIQRIVRSSIDFSYERPVQEDLVWMRQTFRLDEVIAGGTTELQKLQALTHWVARRVNVRPGPWRKQKEPFPWNIRTVLTTDKGGTIYDHCMSYCEALITAATALGWQARHWALMGVLETGHEVAEIWVDELGKWVFFDGSLDMYWTDAETGVPLNLLELHNRYLKLVLRPNEVQKRDWDVTDRLRELRNKHQVKCVAGGFCYGEACNWNWKEGHGYMSAGWMQMTPRNDWHSRPDPRFPYFGEGAEGFSGYPLYVDRQTPLTDEVTRWYTRERDFWWTMNQATFRLTRAGEDTLQVECGNSQPFFRRYLSRQDEEAWKPVEAEFAWKLKAGKNRLEVVPENESGRRGQGSVVAVDFDSGA